MTPCGVLTFSPHTAVWPHLAMCGAMDIARRHDMTAVGRHDPDSGAPTVVDVDELAAWLHADATAMAADDSPWRVKSGHRSLLAADWGPMSDDEKRAVLARRVEVGASLPEHWQDLAAGFGINRLNAPDLTVTRPRDGVSFWDMTPLNKGAEIVRSRLVPAAEHIAARPVASIADALRTGRGELAKDSLLAGWGEAHGADSVHALLAMWGMSWFQPNLRPDLWARRKLPVGVTEYDIVNAGTNVYTDDPPAAIGSTPCTYRVNSEKGWLMFPINTTWWTPAKWQRVLRATARWCPHVLDDDTSIDRTVKWPREARAIAVWERTVTAVGPSIVRDTHWSHLLPAPPPH